MGRFGIGQAGTGVGQYGALDLFRYTSPGVLVLVPTNGAYCSIDSGTTVINIFNGTGSGDLSDWSGATFDSYNAFLTSGKKLDASAGDLTVMDVIGYDRLVPGDFNRDGRVDAADILSMLTALTNLSAYQSAKNLTSPQITLLGDLNGDGSVTNADIQSLLDRVAGSAGGSGAGVPEPVSMVLILLAAASWSLRRGRDA
jgi:hypothetical protein